MFLIQRFTMLVLVLFVIFCTSAYADDIKVDIPYYGSIIGTEEISRGLVRYYAFRGVQYGKAPKDELRFQDPQKPKPWGVRQAKNFGNRCPQADYFGPEKVTGDEDCLNLNVFTQTISPDAKLPVMVFIHGGGFFAGAGAPFDPHYFMDKPMVFVTFNYRLGALGFMHLDDEYLPGNYGMKDQVAVLEWVQKFIHLFGGNSEQVTLAGFSSGSICVLWHMHSPLSKGLFHQAISQGAPSSMMTEIPRHVAQKRARAIATMAGCVYESTEENVKCLRRIPAEELIRIQLRLNIWKGYPYNFGVVVESPNSVNPFTTVSLWNSKPHTEKIPLMIGFTADEGGGLALSLLSKQGEAFEELGQKYERLLPVIMMYQSNMGLESEEAVFHYTKEIRQHYFDQLEINKSTFPRIKKMLAESEVHYDTVVTLKKYEFPRFFYIYSHRNEHTFAEIQQPEPLIGSSPVHNDELISLFKLPRFDLNEADLKVSNHMINLWASFITKGDPNYDSNNKLHWNPVKDGNELNFYSIGVQPEVGVFQWQDLYSFYERLGWHPRVSTVLRKKDQSAPSKPISKL